MFLNTVLPLAFCVSPWEHFSVLKGEEGAAGSVYYLQLGSPSSVVEVLYAEISPKEDFGSR